MKLPAIVILCFYAMEQVWTAEDMDEAAEVSKKAEALGTQRNFP